jgi:hypothetical protein
MPRSRRERQAGIRLSEPTYAALRQRAAAEGLTFAEYARRRLTQEVPHLRILDDVYAITKRWTEESDPEFYVALLQSALVRVEQGEAELVEEEAVERDSLGQRYEVARAALAGTKKELQDRIAHWSGVITMVRMVHKHQGRD